MKNRKTFSLPLEPRPALMHPADVARGLPQRISWPKIPIRIGGQQIVVDVLMKLDNPGHDPHLVVVELDEGPPTPASVHRERLLQEVGIRTVRVTGEDLLSEDYGAKFDARIREAIRAGAPR